MEQVWIILLSRLARALWIEILHVPVYEVVYMSRLARALWIEIYQNLLKSLIKEVEARESLVD